MISTSVIACTSPDAVARALALASMPGVVFNSSKSQLIVPLNALSLVTEALSGIGGLRWIQRSRAATHSLTTVIDSASNVRRILSAPGLRSVIQRRGDEQMMPLNEYFTTYQNEGIIASCDRGFGLLRWPTGSGKSAGGTVVLASQTNTRCVIVTRATNRVGFKREVERYSNERVEILEGMTPYPIPVDARYLILGWETLPAWVQAIIYSGAYCVLFDEIHKCRNIRRSERIETSEGVTWKRLQNISASALDLSRGAAHNAVWGMTATPIEDRRKDLYIPLDLLEPGGWGSWKSYATYFADGHLNSYGGFVAKGKTVATTDELRARFAAITHDVPESVVEAQLPGADVIFNAVSKADQCGAAAFAEELKEASKAGATMMERSQAMRAATKKRPMALDRIEEVIDGGGRIMVLTGRVLDAEKLALETRKRLDGCGYKDVNCYLIHGEISLKSRQTMLDAYQLESRAVIVGTTDSLGESLDGLQCTRWLLFIMLPNTPGQLQQAMGRIKRLGQRERATIELMWAEGDEYDERAVGRLIRKLPDLRDVVGTQAMAGVEVGLRGNDLQLAASLFNKISSGPIDDGFGVGE